MKKYVVSLTVNGEKFEILAKSTDTLLDLLRSNLGLTGTKRGCNTGECGACTVIMDGKAVNSCLILALDANGRNVQTVEGLTKGDKLHPLQEAFVQYGAIQCGYCTPGMIMSAKALLDEKPDPTENEIREAISGNLCRCTGYQKIVIAILHVSREGKL